jgi:hypothetical protein
MQRDRDQLDDLVEASRSRGPQKCFQLPKREFDRIEFRTVGWQKPQVATSRSSGRSDKTRPRNLVCFRRAIEPVSRRRCTRRWTQARLTSNLAATLSASMPRLSD